MVDRLGELLSENSILYGMLCRDPGLTDIELIAGAGYHVVWMDAEHAAYNPVEIVRLCRTIMHLGMVPMVRVPELTRTQMQVLLDGGVQIVLLPNVTGASQAEDLVRMGKFPPVGERGIGSTCPAFGYNLGAEPETMLQEVNSSTHLAVLIESDEGLGNIEEICAVSEIDMVMVGPTDWGAGLGLYGPSGARAMIEKSDAVLAKASAAGKITAAISVSGEAQAKRFIGLGVRILFAGIDVALRRKAFTEAISTLQAAAASGPGR